MDGQDQRAALAAVAAARGDSLASLSRLIGRNAAYLQQFMTRGSPRVLPERERRLLARHLGVDDAALGGPSAEAMASVRRLDVDVAAGSGGFSDDPAALVVRQLPADLLRSLGVAADQAALVRVAGDSMFPLLLHGDEVLVNLADRTVGRRPVLMVARIDHVLLVKRLSRHAGTIRVVSDNPAYPERSLPADDVAPLGRVVWMTRRL